MGKPRPKGLLKCRLYVKDLDTDSVVFYPNQTWTKEALHRELDFIKRWTEMIEKEPKKPESNDRKEGE
jgi:hypothetical protein